MKTLLDGQRDADTKHGLFQAADHRSGAAFFGSAHQEGALALIWRADAM
jgi:hypothetical protein